MGGFSVSRTLGAVGRPKSVEFNGQAGRELTTALKSRDGTVAEANGSGSSVSRVRIPPGEDPMP
jgi:hypothetical protein